MVVVTRAGKLQTQPRLCVRGVGDGGPVDDTSLRHGLSLRAVDDAPAGGRHGRGHTGHISSASASTSDGTALEWGELGPSLRRQLVKFFFFSFSLVFPQQPSWLFNSSCFFVLTPHPPCCVDYIWCLQGSDSDFFFSRL